MMRRSRLLSGAACGAVAGAVGTAAMDAFWRLREPFQEREPEGDEGAHPRASRAPSRRSARAGGCGSSRDAASDGWVAASASAHVGRRVYEGVTQRALEARFAHLVGAVVHWGYGMWWGSLLGMVAARTSRLPRAWNPAFGMAVWSTSYLLLPVTGLYRPVWKYRAPELFPDLIAHLVYGTGTASALALMVRIGREPSA